MFEYQEILLVLADTGELIQMLEFDLVCQSQVWLNIFQQCTEQFKRLYAYF